MKIKITDSLGRVQENRDEIHISPGCGFIFESENSVDNYCSKCGKLNSGAEGKYTVKDFQKAFFDSFEVKELRKRLNADIVFLWNDIRKYLPPFFAEGG